jgi:hypothetical protein
MKPGLTKRESRRTVHRIIARGFELSSNIHGKYRTIASDFAKNTMSI